MRRVGGDVRCQQHRGGGEIDGSFGLVVTAGDDLCVAAGVGRNATRLAAFHAPVGGRADGFRAPPMVWRRADGSVDEGVLDPLQQLAVAAFLDGERLEVAGAGGDTRGVEIGGAVEVNAALAVTPAHDGNKSV
ncbi:MAG: hypothetical protein ACOYLQ_09850 [Hyphomicrobiaceae bacterium]